MYDKSDPRSQLSDGASAKPRTGLIAEYQGATFYDSPPQEDTGTAKTWYQRGCNQIVLLTTGSADSVLERHGQVDEYAVLLPDAGARIEWNGKAEQVSANSIVFVPPGDSRVTLLGDGTVLRLFTSASSDLVAKCVNADAYSRPRSHIPPLELWPMPKGGWDIRPYNLDVPAGEERFGRIFRCTSFMVNVLYPFDGPRDSSALSPHHHDEFEQCSVALEGEFTHYLRWPWTTDLSDWRDDATLTYGSPSSLVIPPPVIHTTRASGPGQNRLVDIFCPPRVDFSLRPGWVLNEADYPMPTTAS